MSANFLYMRGYQRNLLNIVPWGLFLFFTFLVGFSSKGQDSSNNSQFPAAKKTVIAGKQYAKSSFHQWLWGKHYRKEWTTPVTVSTLNLDTVDGGLTAYEAGGGRQTKTLRLKNAQEKEYVLRSIDKTFGKAMPEIYQGTIVEDVINDQVSTALPYAAITIPAMASAAKIYH
ncbi:MAG TPA: hypothetical protein VFN95_18495, partial [Flavitalea sp.]|nr:hypothetical protein [Flavitalea sp.]